jgi:hypothetical protein
MVRRCDPLQQKRRALHNGLETPLAAIQRAVVKILAIALLISLATACSYSQPPTSSDGTPSATPQQMIFTPYGRYHQKVSNIVGTRWQRYLQEHPKVVGDVTILVKVDHSGKVVDIQVIANHSMDDLAELSKKAIMESVFPPVPIDLAPMLRDGKLQITFNFNVYDPNKDSPSNQTVRPTKN